MSENTFNAILDQVRAYYSEKIAEHGASPRGVDWKSAESQELRFSELQKIIREQTGFSINDYGCGYGSLLDYLTARHSDFVYTGFDISPSMIAAAQQTHVGWPACQWVNDPADLSVADYTIASGIFNVKLGTDEETWNNYILTTLKQINDVSLKGFAFNVLTLYSDVEKRRSDLFYANPLALFDHCKRNYSRFVTLLHDYPLYEFTILVRK